MLNKSLQKWTSLSPYIHHSCERNHSIGEVTCLTQCNHLMLELRLYWGLDAFFLSFNFNSFLSNEFSEACSRVTASTPVQTRLKIKGLQRLCQNFYRPFRIENRTNGDKSWLNMLAVVLDARANFCKTYPRLLWQGLAQGGRTDIMQLSGGNVFVNLGLLKKMSKEQLIILTRKAVYIVLFVNFTKFWPVQSDVPTHLFEGWSVIQFFNLSTLIMTLFL